MLANKLNYKDMLKSLAVNHGIIVRNVTFVYPECTYPNAPSTLSLREDIDFIIH